MLWHFSCFPFGSNLASVATETPGRFFYNHKCKNNNQVFLSNIWCLLHSRLFSFSPSAAVLFFKPEKTCLTTYCISFKTHHVVTKTHDDMNICFRPSTNASLDSNWLAKTLDIVKVMGRGHQGTSTVADHRLGQWCHAFTLLTILSMQGPDIC